MAEEKSGLFLFSIVAVAAIAGIVMMIAVGLNSSEKVGELSNNAVGMVAQVINSDASYMALDSTGSVVDANTVEARLGCRWTDWKNRDSPSGTGDWESLLDFPDVCRDPVAVDCQTAGGLDYKSTNQAVSCTAKSGLICQNSLNTGGCRDYKVRFCCPTTATYVPFNIGIGDTAPSSDTMIATDVASQLAASNKINPLSVGIAKLFSEINALQLDNKVTLAIYYGQAVIIVGEHSPASHTLLAAEVSRILYARGITAKVILSSEVTSTNLADLFKSATPSCTDSDGGKTYYVKGTLTGTSKTDYCVGGTSNDLGEYYCSNNAGTMEYVNCPNGCSDGKCFYPGFFLKTNKSSYNINEVITLLINPAQTGKYVVDLYASNDEQFVLLSSRLPISGGTAYDIDTSAYSIFSKSGSITLGVKDAGMDFTQGQNSNAIFVNIVGNSCTDSDGGNVPNVVGEANNGVNGQGDICDFGISNNVLKEAVCENGVIAQKTVTCSGSTPYCFEGACSSIMPTCTDSDGGNDLAKAGYVTVHHMRALQGGGIPYNDYCHINNDAVESCSGPSCSIREFTCEGLALGYADVACPNGCNYGACISDSTGVVMEVKEIHLGNPGEIVLETRDRSETYTTEGKFNQVGNSLILLIRGAYHLISLADITVGHESIYVDGLGPFVEDDIFTLSTAAPQYGGMCILNNTNNALCSYNGIIYAVENLGGCGVSATDIAINYMEGANSVTTIATIMQGYQYKLKNGITVKNLGAPCSASILTLQFVQDNSQNTCADTDGGRNYAAKGTMTATTSQQSYTDQCIGDTATNYLQEYSCSNNMGSMEEYRCPRECRDGACANLPSNFRAQTYDEKCGDNIVGWGEQCDGGNFREDAFVLVELFKESSGPGTQETVVIGGKEYIIKLLGLNGNMKTATISVNGEAMTLTLSQQKTLVGLGLYVSVLSTWDNGEVGNVRIFVTGRDISECSDLEGYVDGELSCTSNCRYDTSKCINDLPPVWTSDVTLKDFPQPFLTQGGIPNGIFVVGRRAALDDVIGITDIIASLQRYAGNNPFPVGLVQFDDTLPEDQIYSNNVVIVGGMCANWVAELMYESPADCTSQDTPGVGKIRIMRNPRNSDKLVLLVHGYNAEDTTRATRVLADWTKFNQEFKENSELCVTGPLSAIKVSKCN